MSPHHLIWDHIPKTVHIEVHVFKLYNCDDFACRENPDDDETMKLRHSLEKWRKKEMCKKKRKKKDQVLKKNY